METRSKHWKAAESPRDYFRRHGRRVRCTSCGTWQRTDPESHQRGKRIREMGCVREGCRGRLRSQGWWKRLDSDLAQTQRGEGGVEGAGGVGLGVDVASLFDGDETNRSQGSRE